MEFVVKYFLKWMFPNTTDPFSDLILLYHWWSFAFSWRSLHGLLWHHIFLPVFLLSSCSFQKCSGKFQLFCCDLQSPPSLVSTHISNLTFKFHSAHLHQESFPDFKSRIILYNYLTKHWYFFFLKYIEDFICIWHLQVIFCMAKPIQCCKVK